MLWPLYWSNTCCSHPRKNEDITDAIHRRLYEEMGLKSRLQYVFKFRYKARYKNVGSENEFCSVFAGKFYGSVRPNSDEIAEWKFIKINDFPIVVDANGNWETNIKLKDGDNLITIIASDLAGNTESKIITVNYQKEE